MINEILDKYSLYICIGLGVFALFIIISLITSNIKRNKKVEPSKSILDVDIDGVVEGDFTYGYEKEDTVVMKPVEKEKPKKKTTKKSTKKKK